MLPAVIAVTCLLSRGVASCDPSSASCHDEVVEDVVEMLQFQEAHPHQDDFDPDFCEQLRSATWPTGRVLCDDEIRTFGWDVYNVRCSERTPALILQPSTSQDVQEAVKFARERSLSISFRSSGHTYNCDGFQRGSLNLDLRTLGSNVTIENRVGKNGTESVAIMSPGATFQSVFDVLPTNLSFTHGTCNTVGVMGYHLHGGWGETTSTWANESIVEMEVVAADGILRTLSADSEQEEARLWKAMRVAGSSFGIVTKLTVRLFNHAERPILLLAVLNGFEDLLSKVPDEAEFGWVGLARWDTVFYERSSLLGHGWFLQIVLSDGAAATEEEALAWIAKNNITVATNFSSPPNLPVNSETWLYGLYPFEDASVFTRFYPLSEIREAARVLEGFFQEHAKDCRYNLGPLQGLERLPVVTVECNTRRTARLLRHFVSQNREVLRPDKPGSGYINLPLDGSSRYRQAYFPQYAELAKTKCIWDPEDFFYIKDGIHPSGC